MLKFQQNKMCQCVSVNYLYAIQYKMSRLHCFNQPTVTLQIEHIMAFATVKNEAEQQIRSLLHQLIGIIYFIHASLAHSLAYCLSADQKCQVILMQVHSAAIITGHYSQLFCQYAHVLSSSFWFDFKTFCLSTVLFVVTRVFLLGVGPGVQVHILVFV